MTEGLPRKNPSLYCGGNVLNFAAVSHVKGAKFHALSVSGGRKEREGCL